MRSFKLFLFASVALGSFGAVEVAKADTVLYGGGATFPAIVYRQLFDCWGIPADGNPPSGVNGTGPYIAQLAISPACPNASGNMNNIPAQILYAPVGSGNGKTALKNHNGAATSPPGLGTPSSSPIPYVSTLSPNFGYGHLEFIGSDDTWNLKDSTDWASKGNFGTYGKTVQIPALAGPIVIAINGNDENGSPLNIQTSTPTGGSSGLRLSRQVLCGIAAGRITKWNHPLLTALNNNQALGTGNITFVHRDDGSGSTFIFASAMFAQCQGQFGTDDSGASVSYEFPYTDKNDATTCPVTLRRPANKMNWPNYANDQCSNANPTAGLGHFVNATGNQGVANTVLATPGSIGYSTADYVKPVKASGPATANIQGQFDIDNSTGSFQPPTVGGVETAISQVNLLFSSPADYGNPLNWSTQLPVTNPVKKDAYPIVGFTYLDFYQCYAKDPNRMVLDWIFHYLGWHYTNPAAKAIINANGFATVPSSFIDPIVLLVTHPDAAAMNYTDSSPGCSGIIPGA